MFSPFPRWPDRGVWWPNSNTVLVHWVGNTSCSTWDPTLTRVGSTSCSEDPPVCETVSLTFYHYCPHPSSELETMKDLSPVVHVDRLQTLVVQRTQWHRFSFVHQLLWHNTLLTFFVTYLVRDCWPLTVSTASAWHSTTDVPLNVLLYLLLSLYSRRNHHYIFRYSGRAVGKEVTS